MSIGSITATGKQNVESGGLYRVAMRGTAVINSKTYDITCYALVHREISSINDMATYILRSNSSGTGYYSCNGINNYPDTALAVFTVVQGYRSSSGVDGTLSLKGIQVYGSNTQKGLSVNVTSISCEKM